MHNAHPRRSALSMPMSVVRYWPITMSLADQVRQERYVDGQFIEMLKAFRCSGGLARADEVVALCKRRGGPRVDMLASWIVAREVIAIEWRGQTWLPFFQFKQADMSPPLGLMQVLTELNPVYDPWAVATWFGRPNEWLDECTPIDMMSVDLDAVLAAARADRAVAHG